MIAAYILIAIALIQGIIVALIDPSEESIEDLKSGFKAWLISGFAFLLTLTVLKDSGLWVIPLIVFAPLSMGIVTIIFKKVINLSRTFLLSNRSGASEVNLSTHSNQHVIPDVAEKEEEEIITEEQIKVSNLDEIYKVAAAFESNLKSYVDVMGQNRSRIESRQQKKRIALLENFACQVCNAQFEFTNSTGEKAFRIDVDHILEKSKGGGEEMRNLWVLCPNCHLKKTIGKIRVNLQKQQVYQDGKLISLHHDRHLFT